MPIYEYKCSRCGQPKEIIARITEDVESPKCTECLIPMDKVVSQGTNFQLKGSGWTPKGPGYLKG